MSLLLIDVEARRMVAKHSLAPLAEALRMELEPLVSGPLVIPERKARLTRIGGRCELDGTLLEFDPWSPREHRCRNCGRVYAGQAHDDWWAMGAQLWTAERAAQGAALRVVRDDKAAGAVALRILDELANRYSGWPNQDNALGPTRPFFSTYLESIWLLNLCHAISLLQSAPLSDEAARVLSNVRDKLVAPSRDLIASYHEGRSNRQVWNEVAILSASRVLNDARMIERRLDSATGFHNLIATGLLDDGTWYEGENYHLFAHRGLWYGVQLLRALGRPLDAKLDARYRAGFVTPFQGVLPDDCIPSRRDSQYAVSIRQWRFAEWCELGIAHTTERDGRDARPDPRLTGTLQRLYEAGPDVSLQYQARHPYSTADAERNEPAGLLSRADLSWRALLMADAELQSSRSWSPGSVCLPSQGLAVIRRDRGQLYVALEGGHTGGGHGHPDRLALTLQHGRNRWLEDPGTGSYVERKLHWYRSTLAHAAPLIDGASQDAVPATLLAFEDRGWAGWMKKRVVNMKPGVNVTRTVVVCEGHVIDLLEWDADREVQIDLPVARAVDFATTRGWQPANPGGAGGLEDGFDFLVDAEVDRGERLSVLFERFSPGAPATHVTCRNQLEPWRALAPGAPGRELELLHWVRTRGVSGRITSVWLWPEVSSYETDDARELTVSMVDGTKAIHAPTDTGWHIDLKAGNATSSIDLELLPQSSSTDAETAARQTGAASGVAARGPERIPSSPLALTLELGEAHYLRTEQSWAEAGEPRATVSLSRIGRELQVTVEAHTGTPTVPAAGDENELDNERPDVNSDGVQLYVGLTDGQPWNAAWLAVPAPESAPLARVTSLTPRTPAVPANWDYTATGWTMTLHVPVEAVSTQPDGTFLLELIVNERPAHRVRRRGQLVMSGDGGFAYLRGDRTESAGALTFILNDR